MKNIKIYTGMILLVASLTGCNNEKTIEESTTNIELEILSDENNQITIIDKIYMNDTEYINKDNLEDETLEDYINRIEHYFECNVTSIKLDDNMAYLIKDLDNIDNCEIIYNKTK